MKKLMIAACAVAFAAVANAATASWGTDETGALLDPSGYDMAWDGSGYFTMYLWSIDQATYNGYMAKGLDGISAAVWADYKDNLASAMTSASDTGSGQVFVDDSTTYGAGNTAYAAIVMTYDEGDGITHYKGNIGSWNFEADVDQMSANMDNFVLGDTNGTELAWSAVAVPEPTSGLLLLLGVAGLALRRCRA